MTADINEVVQSTAVLMVDDEPMVLAAMARLLRPTGTLIFTAAGGAEAMQLLEQHPGVIGVVISDYAMPEMNGAALLRAVRLRWPDVTRVLLTGNADLGAAAVAVNEGQLSRLFLKPWDPLVFRQAVLQVIEERRLILENRRLLALLENAATALWDEALEVADAAAWDWDLATGMIRWSGRIEQQLGVPPGTFRGSFEEYVARVHPDDRARVVQAMQRAQHEGVEYAEEFRIVWNDGTHRWVHARGGLHRDSAGQPARMLGIGVDLTSRKEMETLRLDAAAHEAAVKAKDEIMGLVNHELRTPLASLVGFAELLLTREWPEPRRREFLEIMLREGKRLTTLINDFLDLQRLETGTVEVAATPVHVHEAAERALQALGEDAQCPILMNVPSDLPAVLADPDRLHQVLLNLLSNARKYSPDGGAIMVAARGIPGGMLEITVADRGLGLPGEALPKLFDSFYRVDNSDRRTIKGTGLGLAIVKNLVEALGGWVWADSPGLGQGSTFGLTLPLANPAMMHPGSVDGSIT